MLVLLRVVRQELEMVNKRHNQGLVHGRSEYFVGLHHVHHTHQV